MRLIFNFPQFRNPRGRNLKILTVGIPAGFSSNFQAEVDINTDSFNDIADKERDIVRVDVYRKAINFEDIVFKPRSYYFELSRFVSRSSLSNIDLIPGFSPEAAAELGITFMKDFSRRARGNDLNLSGFLFSPDYSFMTNPQKINLIYNHMVDYALEIYLKLKTGISTDETDYLINRDLLRGKIDADARRRFNDLITVYVEGLTGQPLTIDQLKDASPQIKALLDKIDTFRLETNFTEQIVPPTLPGVSRSKSVELTEDLINFLKVYNPKSLLTGGFSQKQRIVSPKIFERIFNLAVDPDDFEIDTVATNSTTAGSRTRNQLLKRKLIIQNGDVEKLAERSPTSEISFDEFFVTINTVGANV
jgi:hypothetical protein